MEGGNLHVSNPYFSGPTISSCSLTWKEPGSGCQGISWSRWGWTQSWTRRSLCKARKRARRRPSRKLMKRQFFTGAGLQERPSTLLRLKKHTPCFYKMPKCLSIPLLKHDTYLHIFLKHFTLMYCLGPSGARGWRRRRIKGIVFRPIFNNNKNSTSAQFLLLCQFYHSSILVMWTTEIRTRKFLTSQFFTMVKLLLRLQEIPRESDQIWYSLIKWSISIATWPFSSQPRIIFSVLFVPRFVQFRTQWNDGVGSGNSLLKRPQT